MEFIYKYKKIFLVIGFLAVVFLLAYLLYALFFKPSLDISQPIDTAPAVPGTFPQAGTGPGQIVAPSDNQQFPIIPAEKKPDEIASGGLTKTEKIFSDSNLGATIGKDGKTLQFYNPTEKKFYKISNDGELELLSNQDFFNIENIVWSPNKDKAVIEYPDGAKIIYDFNANKQITLPKHWKDFDFSPAGDKLVLKSMGLDPSNRWLAVSNTDGSQTIAIEHLGTKDANVYPLWSPNQQIIAMFTEGIDFDRQEVYFVGLNNENFKSTIIEGRGFQPIWSERGDKLVYSVYSSNNDFKPMLWVVNASGEAIGSGRKSLGIETWAEKCVFADNNSVYCAVPKDLESGAGIFPELADHTNDDLYKIDINTGLRQLVAIPDGIYNMSNLNLNNDNSVLYFTDKKQNEIYKINLK
jgi:WD40 repeat protein